MQLFIRELHKRNNILFWFGFSCFLAFFISLGLMISDKTLISGENAWGKPVKYLLSTGITAWTLGWILDYLKSKKIISILSWIIFLSLLIKNSIVLFQTSRGIPSHYNLTNPTNSFLYQLIIVADVIFLLSICIIAFLFFNQKKMSISQHYTWSIRMGFLNFLLFSVAGIIMHIQLGHLIGGVSSEGHQIPLLNWSTKYSDLRIIHFMGIHSLQIIPLTSYYLFNKKVQTIAFAALYLLLGLFLFAISFAGIPLF